MKHWIFFLVLFGNSLMAQKSFTLEATLGDVPLQCGQWKVDANSDSLQVNRCAMYLSGLQFFANGKPLLTAEKPILINFCNGAFTRNQVPENADSVAFLVGIDSLFQSAGALGGDLDPVHGMYWTWQSGYIHVKVEARTSQLEGESHSIVCHLGGYSAPFNSNRQTGFRLNSQMHHTINLDQFLESESFSQVHKIMSPSLLATKLSDDFIDSINSER
jgi:hypothetical protein